MVQALAERHPDRVLTVRYEDLVLTPEPVLRRICAFLGLEYSDTILDAMNGDEARRIAARSELWGSNDKSLNSGYIDKYLNQLARDEIERIESLAGAHMRRYGYEFHTPAEADITPRVLEAAGRRSEAAEAAAWRDLQRRDPRDYQLRRYRAWYLESVRTRLLAAQGRRAKATAPAGRPRPV
jgi:hypothetical protein